MNLWKKKDSPSVSTFTDNEKAAHCWCVKLSQPQEEERVQTHRSGCQRAGSHPHSATRMKDIQAPFLLQVNTPS